MIKSEELEKIIEAHPVSKGVISIALRVLKIDGLSVSTGTVKKCWESKELPAYTHSEYVHTRVDYYARKLKLDSDSVALKINQELKPYSTVSYEGIRAIMRREGLCPAKTSGGPRQMKKLPQPAKKQYTPDQKHYYKFCTLPEAIG